MEETDFGYTRNVWSEIRPRLGARQPVAAAVAWCPTAPASRRKRRRGPRLRPGLLHDISVSGARVLVPIDDAVAPHRKLELLLDGSWTTAQIAWVQPSDEPAAVWCGVVFLHPDAEFIEAIARASNGLLAR